MVLNNLELNCSLRVRHTVGGEEQWDKVIDLLTPTGSKVLKGFTDIFFFNLPNGDLFGKNIAEDLSISNILIGLGDGTTTSFSYTAAPVPIKENSVSISYTVGGTQYTATDDGSGNITGTELSSGTVDYSTGDISLEFNTAPDSGTTITLSYMRGVSADDTYTAGFTFVLTTDASPSLGEGPFGTTVPLTVTPIKVDWYETETHNIYRVLMTSSYTDTTETDKITALGIVYRGIKGTAAGTTVEDTYILKSTEVGTSALFGADGLKLSNQCDIFVDFRFAMRK